MEPLQRWCIEEGYFCQGWEALIGGFVARIRAEGIPLDRLSVSLQVLHPILGALNWIWADGEMICHRHNRTNRYSSEYLLSPTYRLVSGQEARIRQRLDVDDPGFPVLVELKRRGYRDYLALGLRSGDGKRHMLSAATRDPAGFTEAQVDALERVIPFLQILLDRHLHAQLSRTIAETYIGPRTGPRVMQGAILLGEISRLRAAIWFSDVRDFTGLSLRLGEEEIVDLLNQYFGAVGAAVEECRGEILKFIGDAALIIFPAEDDTPAAMSAACLAALRCMERVGREIVEINRQRAGAGQPPIRYGVGLHAGEVAYGNIGAPDRLDFTVIGSAVNLASRLEGLCGTLDAPAVLSDAFVAALPPEIGTTPLGTFPLKGIPLPQEVYRLA